MEQNFETFKRQVEQIKYDIENGEYDGDIIKETDNTCGDYPMSDGIVNLEKYWYSKFKILWILQEPYDEPNGEQGNRGGGNSIIPWINGNDWYENLGRTKNTFNPIILASFGLLNNFILYNDILPIDDAKIEIIKNIAIINVSKMPGTSSSQSGKWREAYHKHKSLLLRQIDTYNPDIVIFGNNYELFYPDLGLSKDDETVINELCQYIIRNSRLYINTYHPSRQDIKEYVNSIMEAGKRFGLTREVI